jgi:hypothetical protein
MLKQTFDFTNETASHPPAQKKRPFAGSTLATCDLSFKKRSSYPPAEKNGTI